MTIDSQKNGPTSPKVEPIQTIEHKNNLCSMLSDLGLLDNAGHGVAYIQAFVPKLYGSKATPMADNDGHEKLRYRYKGSHRLCTHTMRLTIADGDVRLDERSPKGQWGCKADGLQGVQHYLTELNKLGFSIYVVVNPGGLEDADITQCNCIFWEHDGQSLAEQAAVFAKLQGELGGGFAIETRSSLHCYFRLETPISPAQWADFQKRIIKRLGSDSKIKNPARLMRLPGFDHTKMAPADAPGQPHKIERVAIDYLHHWDGQTTSLDAVEAAFPPLPPEEPKPEPRKAPVNLSSGGGSIQDFLEQRVYPVLTPERLYDGLNLVRGGKDHWRGSCPWHESQSGTAFWVKPSEDGKVYRFACPECTKNVVHGPLAYVHGLRTGRISEHKEEIKGSDYKIAAQMLADKAGLGSEFADLLARTSYNAPVHYEHGTTLFPDRDKPATTLDLNKHQAPPPMGAANAVPDFTPPSSPAIAPIAAPLAPTIPTVFPSAVDPFAAFGLPSLAEQMAQGAAPDPAGEVVGKVDIEEFRDHTNRITASLDFSASESLPPAMARKMIADAGTLSVPQAYLFGALLTATLSQMGHGHLTVKKRQVPNSAYVTLLGEPSSGKTRARYIYRPILDKDIKARAAYKAALKEWEKEQKAAAKSKAKAPQTETFTAYGNSADEPAERDRPALKKAAFENATIEALCRGLDGVKGDKTGVLFASDEIGNVMGSVSKYSAGNDTGRSALLSLWDGMDPTLIDRVDEDRSYAIDQSRVSLFVGAETDKLAKYLDDDGMSARMLLIYPDPVVSLMSRDADDEDDDADSPLLLAADLPKLYDYLSDHDWAKLRATAEGQAEYADIHNRYSVLSIASSSAPGAKSMARFYGKAAGQVLRVAMALHGIECYYSPDKARDRVTRSTIIKAYDFVELCAGWWRKYWAKQNPVIKASGVMLKILELTKEHGGSLTLGTYSRQISQVRQLIKSEREINPQSKPADVVLGLCRALEDQGRGTVEDAGRGGYKFVLSTTAPAAKSPLTAFGDADRVAEISAYKPERRADREQPKARQVQQQAQTLAPTEAPIAAAPCVGSMIEVTGLPLPDGTVSQDPVAYNANTMGCASVGSQATVIGIENHGGTSYAKVRFQDSEPGGKYHADPVGYLPLTAIKTLAAF